MIKPWALIPAPLAHDVAPFFLSLFGSAVRVLGRDQRKHIPHWQPLTWRGLHFPNPVGLAAGVDKDARNLSAWWALGAGFLEIGTVTPQPQAPNPGSIIQRDFTGRALWNKMGFPSQGAVKVAKRLQALPRQNRPTPVFVNIGKNRTTPNPRAAEDYIQLIQTFAPICEGLVLNISSPNTAGLRELLQPANLKNFLKPILAARPAPLPVLLKLSPDMSEFELRSAIQTSGALGIDGWILTNTTLSREPESPFPTEGGVSGRPLHTLSLQALKWAQLERGTALQSDSLLVSVGGILSPADVQERLSIGADLVQVYSALILEGPQFFRSCAHRSGLADLVR